MIHKGQKMVFSKMMENDLEPSQINKNREKVFFRSCSINLQEGIDKELAKKITALVKQSKSKTQASIQGESIRITGKKRDELQEIISFLKNQEIDIPLQFKNFRD